MFCEHCGKVVSDTAAFCRYCGYEFDGIDENIVKKMVPMQQTTVQGKTETITQKQTKVNTYDKNSGWLNLVSLISPILGCILFIFYKDDYPIRSEGIRDFSISGIIIWSLFGFVSLLSAIFD